METMKSMNYHPVPAVRSSKVNGMQKLYTKFINKIEDLPPKLHTKLQQSQQKSCSLARSPPVKKAPTSLQRPKNGHDNMILSDDDDFYSKLTFDDSEQSLEDEIFEELEKVAHDEAKLNAALQNFDRILHEYNDKKTKEQKANEVRPSAIPKPLQKSKTCSIIESKCILKKQDEKKKNVPTKVERPLMVPAVETFGSITSANYYQVTKSLWNLQDFDEFAKSSANKKEKLGARKSEGAVPNAISRAKSAWDMTQRPTYSRQSSISKIPIKSSKLSTSMLQLNASNSNFNCSPYFKASKTSAFASTLALTTAAQTPSKPPPTRRSSLTVVKKPETSISKYAETKASIQRRNMISSTNSINKMSISIASSKSIPPLTQPTPLKSAKSEMSILHGRFITKDRQQVKQKLAIVAIAADSIHQNRAPMKVKREVESLLDKCLVKGQELLRKAEEFNDANRVDDDKAKSVAVVGKRDYIAKHQPTSSSTKASNSVSMNTKSGSTNNIKNHHKDTNETTLNEANAITNHCTVDDNQTGNHHEQQRQIESEKTALKPVLKSLATRTTAAVEPTLESCEIIIPVVLEEKKISVVAIVDKDTKDYSSDCSDDSGHISNENEDLTTSSTTTTTTTNMDAMKPRKISEELLEIFEKKAQQKVSPLKAKVIELNQVNLIKTSMEIFPPPNKTCKSEVTFFINSY